MSGATADVVPKAEADQRTPVDESAAVGATGWRRWVPWALVVLAAIIGLAAALNVWVKRQALSTDNWTNASSQLLENSEIRNAVSVYLVDLLVQLVDEIDRDGVSDVAVLEQLRAGVRPVVGAQRLALDPDIERCDERDDRSEDDDRPRHPRPPGEPLVLRLRCCGDLSRLGHEARFRRPASGCITQVG